MSPRIGYDAQSISAVSDDTLIGEGPFDLQKTLRTIMRRHVSVSIISFVVADRACRQDAAEILPRELGVVFQNLTVLGLGASASFQPTLGSILNPMVILEQLQALRHPPVREIISGFEGVIRPGEMLRMALLPSLPSVQAHVSLV